jgi:hypothetical protein
MDWLDKFNLKVEVSQEELKSTLTNIATKAVKYELVTSIIQLVFIVVCMYIAYRLFKYLVGTKNIKESVLKIKSINTIDIVKEPDTIVKIVVFCVAIVMLFAFAISEVVDIVECLVFPEKVVIEFIGRYLN